MIPGSQKDLDWALCSLNRDAVHVNNTVSLPNGEWIRVNQIASRISEDSEVWIQTGPSGIVRGFLVQNHSLVSLPGRGKFQRMWIVVLDRLVSECP
jgi:hypothetical protein